MDPVYCDFCNAEINAAPHGPDLPRFCPIGPDGLELTQEQQSALARPEASLLIKNDGRWQRVHWINHETLPLWSARMRERLAQNSLRCLASARLVEQDAGDWLVVEATGTPFEPWANPLDDPNAEVDRLLGFLEKLTVSLEELHSKGLVWLTFDPRRMEETAEGNVRFTNLDLNVYPEGQCPERLHLRARFAAPEIIRYKPDEIGPRSDIFHLALFAYYWLAHMLPHGFAGEGLASFDYQIPKLRIYAPDLPLGIAPVLAQALAVDPTARYPSPRALLDALRAAVARNRERAAYTGQIAWEIGSDTRIGRTKAALGKDNEDRLLASVFKEPERALLAIADGISTCNVGSGGLASLVTSIVVENAFDAKSTRAVFAERVAGACRQCADTLLSWAMEKGYRQQLQDGADLMGTTLTAAWLEERVASVANLGDSRAYLITDAGEEQLTVDGDLAAGMLEGGTAPERVREIGLVGKALRECIGGCTVSANGTVSIVEECCRPHTHDWPLFPGDVLVLCSDGLVEEGAFLEPAQLGELVRANRHLSAAELARHLVTAADNLHRLPSPLEPEGYGDNISCIVVKIEAKNEPRP